MNQEKYCQILSTYEVSQIEPDPAVKNKSSESMMIECRICLQEHGPFIIPCKCDGTMKHVHQKCLKKWASEKMKKQVKKDQQKAKGKLSNIHGIQCQLCKQNISMEVRKLKRFIGCNEAKKNSQQNFLPFIPLVILNAVISLGCFSGAIFIVAFSLMLAFEDESIDYEKYSQNPMMIWSLLALGFIVSILFTLKSIVQFYYMFVVEEHQVIKVMMNPLVMTTSPKTTQPDCPNTKWFNNLDTLSTPTSPHSVGDNLLQSKLSLTRKNFNLKQKITRQIAQRKLAQLIEFKTTPQDKVPEENSVCATLPKKIAFSSS